MVFAPFILLGTHSTPVPPVRFMSYGQIVDNLRVIHNFMFINKESNTTLAKAIAALENVAENAGVDISDLFGSELAHFEGVYNELTEEETN